MDVMEIPIGQLKRPPYHPRRDLGPGDPRRAALDRSVGAFGLVQPLVWNRRTGHVVGGNQRLRVALAAGAETLPCVVVDLPLGREKQLNLALNRVQGDWDGDRLAALLDELLRTPDLDLALTGFGLDEARGIVDGLLGADPLGAEDPGAGAALGGAGGPEPVTRPGDLVLLGRDPRTQHRLLCGDCTSPDDVARVMMGERAVLMATDPPYLVGYDGTNHPGGDRPSRNRDWSGTYGVAWDDADAGPELYDRFVGAALEHALAPDAAIYVWHASRRRSMLVSVLEAHGVLVHCEIVWVKARPVLTRSWYMWRHEPCVMGWRKGRMPGGVGAGKLSTVWEFPSLPSGDGRPDHPTPKPLELFEIPLAQHTRAAGETAAGPGDLVYEPFAGSGTQVVAAQRLRRRCAAIEISPAYCDLIVRRFIALAGEGAVDPGTAERYRLPPGAGGPVGGGPPAADARAVDPRPRDGGDPGGPGGAGDAGGAGGAGGAP